MSGCLQTHFNETEYMCAEITGGGGRGGISHLCQLVQSDRLLKQAFVLGLESHFTDDGSRVAGKLIYDSRLEGRRGEEITVRADQREEEEELSKRQSRSCDTRTLIPQRFDRRQLQICS